MNNKYKTFIIRCNNERTVFQVASQKVMIGIAKEMAEHKKSNVHLSTMDGVIGVVVPAHISEKGKFVQTRFFKLGE